VRARRQEESDPGQVVEVLEALLRSPFGTSGSAAERCALVTAMGRSFPALICGTAEASRCSRSAFVGNRGGHGLSRLIGDVR